MLDDALLTNLWARFKRSESFGGIHFNLRSAPKNLCHVEDYLDCLDFSFPIVAASETWLNDSNVDLYELRGLEAINKKTIIERIEKVAGSLFSSKKA